MPINIVRGKRSKYKKPHPVKLFVKNHFMAVFVAVQWMVFLVWLEGFMAAWGINKPLWTGIFVTIFGLIPHTFLFLNYRPLKKDDPSVLKLYWQYMAVFSAVLFFTALMVAIYGTHGEPVFYMQDDSPTLFHAVSLPYMWALRGSVAIVGDVFVAFLLTVSFYGICLYLIALERHLRIKEAKNKNT